MAQRFNFLVPHRVEDKNESGSYNDWELFVPGKVPGVQLHCICSRCGGGPAAHDQFALSSWGNFHRHCWLSLET